MAIFNISKKILFIVFILIFGLVLACGEVPIKSEKVEELTEEEIIQQEPQHFVVDFNLFLQDYSYFRCKRVPFNVIIKDTSLTGDYKIRWSVMDFIIIEGDKEDKKDYIVVIVEVENLNLYKKESFGFYHGLGGLYEGFVLETALAGEGRHSSSRRDGNYSIDPSAFMRDLHPGQVRQGLIIFKVAKSSKEIVIAGISLGLKETRAVSNKLKYEIFIEFEKPIKPTPYD
ncbi:hypothetical protein ES702_03707 [subsurface metagenome]